MVLAGSVNLECNYRVYSMYEVRCAMGHCNLLHLHLALVLVLVGYSDVSLQYRQFSVSFFFSFHFPSCVLLNFNKLCVPDLDAQHYALYITPFQHQHIAYENNIKENEIENGCTYVSMNFIQSTNPHEERKIKYISNPIFRI